jgi:hypothetical protein
MVITKSMHGIMHDIVLVLSTGRYRLLIQIVLVSRRPPSYVATLSVLKYTMFSTINLVFKLNFLS